MKRAALEQACRGGDQKSCQDLAKMGEKQSPQGQQQPGPGQPGQQQTGQRPPRPGQQQQQAGRIQDDSAPFTAPRGTKIEEKVMAPVQDRAKFAISPHGVHVATIETEGSRAVVWYDGVEGPRFDEIIAQNASASDSIVFSPDGNRYAYCARSGNQFVVMVDGKELMRSSEAQSSGRLDTNSCMLGFTSNSKHVFFLSSGHIDNPDRNFTRFVFDGKPEPPSTPSSDFSAIAFSPDGNHYAYVWQDPIGQKQYMLIVDGKPAPYQAGAPQWTSDSKHLYTQRHSSSGMELLYDGKPIARAYSFQIHTTPASDMVVMAVTGGVNFHPFSFLVVNGKKVPGSDTVERGMINEVVFSPDGKHYAAHCQDLSNHHYVITDGKRGEDYSAINDLGFTADSSTVVYGTQVNGKSFLVIGDKEFTGAGGAIKPIIAPAGNRVAAVLPGNNSASLQVLIDGKATPLGFHGGGDLSFSPDGTHFAYLAGDGMTSHIVLDGAPQPQSVFNGNRTSVANGGTSSPYVFSPDSRHIAHLSSAPDAQTGHGVFLDGKFILTTVEGTEMWLTFSPDSKHLFWVHRIPGAQGTLRLFADGKPLADFSTPGGYVLSALDHWWDFNPDGSISFLVQADNSLKRITVTLPSDLSVETMLGASKGLEARR